MANNKTYKRVTLYVDEKKYKKAMKIIKSCDQDLSMSRWFRDKIKEVIDDKKITSSRR